MIAGQLGEIAKPCLSRVQDGICSSYANTYANTLGWVRLEWCGRARLALRWDVQARQALHSQRNFKHCRILALHF